MDEGLQTEENGNGSLITVLLISEISKLYPDLL